MGEEEKKPEEAKAEEKKPEEPKKGEGGEAKPAEKPAEEKKSEEPKAEDAPPPPEIVLKVFMHCEGCARKVRRSLKGFPGVEEVITDTKSHKVVVKGEKADPLKVLERVQRKSHRKVELLSPIPKPPPEEDTKPPQEEKPKPEEKKEEAQIVTVVLKVLMHCEACSLEIQRRILRMKGVESAEPDLKNSVVTVKGVYEPEKLVDFVYKRTGRQAVIVKQDPTKAEEEPKEQEEEGGEAKKEENKVEEQGSGGDNNNNNNKEEEEKKSEDNSEENKEKKEESKPEEEKENEGGGGETEETKKVDEVMKKNEYYCYPQRYGVEVYAYPSYQYQYPYPHPAPLPAYPTYQGYPPPPPQMFSDENPNACTVM